MSARRQILTAFGRGIVLAVLVTAPGGFRVAAQMEEAVQRGAEIGVPPVRSDRWTVMPEAIASFGAAVHDGWLYQYGGHVGRAHQHSTENHTDGFYRLSLIDRTSWEKLPSQDAVQSCALVTVGDRIYRIGGMQALNARGEKERLTSTTIFSCYDPSQREWTSLAPLPEGRSSHDAVAWGTKILVAGGWNLQPDSRAWHTSILAFDTANPDAGWSVVATQPFERRAIDATVDGNQLYVFGGISSKRKLSHEVDVLDLATQKWTKAPELEGNGFGCSATTLGGELHVATMSGKMFRLSENGDRWELASTLAVPRFFHRLEAVSSSELAAVGGASQGGHCRTIEWISPDSPATEMSLLTAEIPYPGLACNRQGMFIDGNSFVVFGGNNSLGQHDFEPHNFLDEAFRISLCDLSVRRSTSFPRTQQSFVEGRAGKAHVAFGGFGPEEGGAAARRGVFVYSPKDRDWSEAGVSLPEPRTQFGVAEWNDETWIFGGLDYDPNRETSFEYPMGVLRATIDASSSKIESAGVDLPRPRRAFGCAQMGEKVFLVGGMKQNFGLVEECDVFDLETHEWSTIPSPRRPRISPELVVFGGDLYLIGGSSRASAEEKFAADPTVEVYRVAEGRWETLLEELPFPVRHLKAAALETRILLYSAHSQEEPKRVRVGLLDPGRHEPSRPASRPKPSSRPSSAL